MRFGTTHWLSPLFPVEYVTALTAQFCARGYALTVLKPTEKHRYRPKLEWFAPWNAHLRPSVVFDLDTFIVGDISPFLDLDPTKLWMIRQFLQAEGNRKAESGIFVAPDNDELCARIWSAAAAQRPERDGDFLRQFEPSLIPDVIDGIYSYKAHGLRNGYPDDARVICLHGKPKNADTDGWARELWLTSLN